MTELEYIACIMCGKTVYEKRFNAAPFDISPRDYIVIQVRRAMGGGKGHGFPTIPGAGKNIVQMWNEGDPRHREIAEVLKERLLNVVRDYIEAGIITKEEI